MKYLDTPQFKQFDGIFDLGDHRIRGRINRYSLKMVQSDKKLVKHLQKQYSDELIAQRHINQNKVVDPQQLGDSIQKIVQVPLGNLHEFWTVRLISYFISTLNNTYADFDFTETSPNQFKNEKAHTVNDTINARLAPLTKHKPSMIDSFWKTINGIMHLNDCNLYSFSPTDEVLECLRPHNLWNIDYFFVNEKTKQLLYLSFYAENHSLGINNECKNNNNNLEIENDMEIDIDIDDNNTYDDDINDSMAWLPNNQMSPPHEKRMKNNKNNGNKHSKHLKKCNNHNHKNANNNEGTLTVMGTDVQYDMPPLEDASFD